jgi:hypothetical protein
MSWVNRMNRMNWANRMTAMAAALIGGLVVTAFVSATAQAKDDADKDWKVLGEAKVEQRGETDEIKVGADEGVFKRIKLEVRGSDVEFKKVTVVYENGDPEQIDVRDKVKRGGQTRAIDLKGGHRAIKKVVLLYKTTGDTDRDARVILLGHK